jgi:hypothetical protein
MEDGSWMVWLLNHRGLSVDAYELISPKTGKPCGVFVCGKCNLVCHKDFVEKCCKPCECGKLSRNRFEAKCSDCWQAELRERRRKQLEAAELVEWDGSMIFSEDVDGYRDGWFDSPDDLLEYLEVDQDAEAEHEGVCVPEFAFLGRKCVNKLDIDRAVQLMTEDTYEDAELNVSDDDWAALLAAVDAFNEKYAVVYYEHDYTKKVRVRNVS